MQLNMQHTTQLTLTLKQLNNNSNSKQYRPLRILNNRCRNSNNRNNNITNNLNILNKLIQFLPLINSNNLYLPPLRQRQEHHLTNELDTINLSSHNSKLHFLLRILQLLLYHLVHLLLCLRRSFLP